MPAVPRTFERKGFCCCCIRRFCWMQRCLLSKHLAPKLGGLFSRYDDDWWQWHLADTDTLTCVVNGEIETLTRPKVHTHRSGAERSLTHPKTPRPRPPG